MRKNKLILIAMLAVSLIFPVVANAQIHIEIGDRPYYTHGASYWDGGYEMVWVPGHWSEHHHHWVHGHYVRREHHRHVIHLP